MGGVVDTRNQAWRSDKSSFGYRMLAKMGWSEGKGLGLNGQGASTHLRVRPKRSRSGLGAAQQGADAWKSTGRMAADFTEVLNRLGVVGSTELGTEGRNRGVGPDRAEGDGKKSYWERKRRRMEVSRYSEADLKEIFGGATVDGVAQSAVSRGEEDDHHGSEELEAAVSPDRGEREKGEVSLGVSADSGVRKTRKKQSKSDRKNKKDRSQGEKKKRKGR